MKIEKCFNLVPFESLFKLIGVTWCSTPTYQLKPLKADWGVVLTYRPGFSPPIVASLNHFHLHGPDSTLTTLRFILHHLPKILRFSLYTPWATPLNTIGFRMEVNINPWKYPRYWSCTMITWKDRNLNASIAILQFQSAFMPLNFHRTFPLFCHRLLSQLPFCFFFSSERRSSLFLNKQWMIDPSILIRRTWYFALQSMSHPS